MTSQKQSFTISNKSAVLISIIGFSLLSLVTVLAGPRLVQTFYPLPEDQGSAWYFWQLGNFENLPRLIVWISYIAHQLAVWGIFIAARLDKKRTDALSSAPAAPDGAYVKPGKPNGDRFTIMMIVANFFFTALHLLQTHLWYGGLAQDVPIWTSQGSVIVMLVLILVMEMPRRGLFFGRWRTVPEGLHRVLRRWHGPYIAWALVYTFWFHPMEGNWGLMSGFVYMFMLFTQLNIFRTSAHKRRSWVVVLEAFVVVHGTLISLYKNLDAWPLFLFGFFFMFIITYMYTWKQTKLFYGIWYLGFAALAFWVYQYIRGWDHAFEMVFIPVALYGGAVALWLVGRAAEVIGTKKKK